MAGCFLEQEMFKTKKALAAAGMVVGKVNADLEKHFQKVGSKMAKEWKKKAGKRGAAVLAAYK